MDDSNYQIKSLTPNELYRIMVTTIGWVCTNAHHMIMGFKCKLIYVVEFIFELRKQVDTQRIEEIVISGCKVCKSDNLIAYGLKHNKHSDIQKFQCNDCKRCFAINIGLEKMKHNPQGITTAMNLYFSDESFRNIIRSLMLLRMEVSHQTIYN